ncbi:hypothetical protein, partial [Limosilactobacillus reuteri]
ISRLETNFINNLKSGLRFLNRSKIIVRILLFENQKLIVNSQPQKLVIIVLIVQLLENTFQFIRYG